MAKEAADEQALNFKKRRREEVETKTTKRVKEESAGSGHQPLTFSRKAKVQLFSSRQRNKVESDKEKKVPGEYSNAIGKSPTEIEDSFPNPLHVFVKGMKDANNQTIIGIGASFGCRHPNNLSQRSCCLSCLPEKLDLKAVVVVLTYLERLGMKDWSLRIFTSSAVHSLAESEHRIQALKEKCRFEMHFGTIGESAEPLQDAILLAQLAIGSTANS